MAGITLDPDFPCYDIVEIFDADHFTFNYYEEVEEGTAYVSCYEYSSIRGDFDAKLGANGLWDAKRVQAC
jgi:hypothetical protein